MGTDQSAARTPGDAWAGFVDDAAVFPPGSTPLPYAVHAWRTRTPEDAALVGSFVLRDTDVAAVQDFDGPLAVVVTGGAGQVAGPVGLAERLDLRVVALEVALRDPDDLAGNARRVVAALAEAGVDDDEVRVHLELPATDPTPSWLAAADVVAEAGLRLKFRTGGLTADAFPAPATLAAWIDAALDRETPFKCTAGLHRAVRHTDDDGLTHHGFGNVLLATERAFDGATPAEVAETLADPAPDLAGLDPTRARRWFTSFGSCSVSEPAEDLRELELIP